MSLKNKVMKSIAAGTLLGVSAIAVVKHNEGENMNTLGQHVSYLDGAGVWTYCWGETKGGRKGMLLSTEECTESLMESIPVYLAALVGLPEDLPEVITLGSLDMAYNIGTSGFSNSTQKKKLMQGDYSGAGDAVLNWRYISRTSTKSPGQGWVHKGGQKWQFDCSQYINGKPNKVCWGLWERRQWQSKAIGNKFKTLQEAVTALPK